MPHLRNRTSLIYRLLEIAILCIVAITALAYPLTLRDSELNWLYASLNRDLFQIALPWLSGGFSPLVLKESLFLTLLVALLFLFTWKKITNQLLGLERSAFDGGKPIKQWLQQPELWAIAFVLFSAISTAWSPVFQQSLQTWVLLASAVSFVFIVRAMPHATSLAVKFMVTSVLLGTILCCAALVQHLNFGFGLPHNSDPRNRMSSLIGHNTGLSCWLMFSLSFSLYFLLVNRRTWVKAMCVPIIALHVLVIMAAQSRAVWVLALIIVIALPVLLLRQFNRRFRLHWVLAAAILCLSIVASLSVSPKTNRLAQLPVSLSQRLSSDVFNLDQLRRETRLRIVTVGLTTQFPRSPILGTGLGSFSWEYPKAQGDYFASHPHSILGTTSRRTDVAHNDYLQVLLETGLIGFALLAGLIWSVGRHLNGAYHQLDSPWQRNRFLTLVFPAAAVCLQALVDFPFHVIPISVVTLTSLALASRLAPSPHTQDALITAGTALPITKAAVGALFITAVIFAFTLWAWQAFVGRVLASDIYYKQGEHWLNEYHRAGAQNIERQLSVIDRARRSYREAVVANVFNGEAYEGQATAHLNRAGIALNRYLEVLADDAASTQVLPLRDAILRDSVQATSITENQLLAGGLRYHYTYYVQGRAHRLMWEVEKTDATTATATQSEHFHQARVALQTALRFNPADAASLRELADMLTAEPEYREEGRKLQQRLTNLEAPPPVQQNPQ